MTIYDETINSFSTSEQTHIHLHKKILVAPMYNAISRQAPKEAIEALGSAGVTRKHNQ